MSMCNGCGRRFDTSQQIKAHSSFCDGSVFQRNTTPSYREYLEKAARKDPTYKIYLTRIDLGAPDNAYNPLATRKETRYEQ